MEYIFSLTQSLKTFGYEPLDISTCFALFFRHIRMLYVYIWVRVVRDCLCKIQPPHRPQKTFLIYRFTTRQSRYPRRVPTRRPPVDRFSLCVYSIDDPFPPGARRFTRKFRQFIHLFSSLFFPLFCPLGIADGFLYQYAIRLNRYGDRLSIAGPPTALSLFHSFALSPYLFFFFFYYP